MKRLLFLALAVLFALCRAFPLQKHKVVLLRRFPRWGSLGLFGDAIERDERLRGYRIVRIVNWRRLSTVYHLATAGTVLLNDGFRPMAHFPFSRRAKVYQLWHADGALKRFGRAAGEDSPEARRWTAAICASEAMRVPWAEGFGMPLERVLALGSPHLDALVAPCDKQALRAVFDEKYPQCKNKRLILYAPSFRDDDPHNTKLLAQFDFEKFQRRFGGGSALLVRLHPKMHGQYTLPDWVIDLTGAPGFADLLRVTDYLITDYASLMSDAAAIGLPMVLYTYDYDEYMAQDRGFYQELRDLPPGPVVYEFDALLDVLARPDEGAQQRKAFVKHHLGEIDGQSCERIIREVFGK